MSADQKIIGVVTTSFGSAFAQKALPGLERAIANSGYSMQLFETMSFNKEEIDFLITDLVSLENLKGIVYLHLLLNQVQLRQFLSRNIKVVNLAGRMEGIDWVMTDEIKGSYEATKLALSRGFKRIAMINGPAISLTTRLREDGYLRALKEAGIEFGRDQGVQILNFVESEGYEAATVLLDQDPVPEVMLVASGDIMALGVYEAIKERKLTVGKDISVIGYDNLPFGKTMQPPLTTVDQPLEAMGEKAMEMMLGRLNRTIPAAAQGVFFDPEMIIRESLGNK